MGESIPPEVVEQLRKFNEALTTLEDTYQENFSGSSEENVQRSPQEKLQVDLMSVFVINSLYWMLLCTHGRKPKENELLENEIKRSKEYIGRLKQVEERNWAPRLNQQAARSFVRNALWEPKSQQQGKISDGDINEDDKGRYGMEGGEEESTSMEGSEEVDEVQMEEAFVNESAVRSAAKRSFREANIPLAQCPASKKKRL